METYSTAEKPVPIPVMLPRSHWNELLLHRVKTGRSASAIIRDLVAAYLEEERLRASRTQHQQSR